MAAAAESRARVGVAWRPELAAGIFAHLDEIDVVEVIADNYFHASRRELDALQALAAQVPLYLHGVGMGMASAFALDEDRIVPMARLIERVRPAGWSEHLAFVRAGGVEIGHLAAAPRTVATVEQTLCNFERTKRLTGMTPALENIATLFEPPMGAMSEAQWTGAIVGESHAPLLLDLHNLYANAINAGREPMRDLLAFPLSAVQLVHISGGCWIEHQSGEHRLLDDHLHAVPSDVFEMLRRLTEVSPVAPTVILERDGRYPPFAELLAEVRAARVAMQVAEPTMQDRRYG